MSNYLVITLDTETLARSHVEHVESAKSFVDAALQVTDLDEEWLNEHIEQIDEWAATIQGDNDGFMILAV